MQEHLAVAGSGLLGPERIVAADSPARVLLAACARGLRGQDCADLGHQPVLARFRGAPETIRRAAIARAAARGALPADWVAEVDVQRVARWIVDHYPAGTSPGVLLGAPHGAAAHLAVALRMPWLPAGFEISVSWPEGAADDPAAALRYAGPVVARLLAANPGITVRQVHDPVGRGVLAGATITLVVRWRRLPEAYLRFLADRLDPGAAVLALRDARTWPVLAAGSGQGFQVGSPASGLDPADFARDSASLPDVLRGAGGDHRRWDPPSAGCPAEFAEHGLEPDLEAELRACVQGRDGTLHRVLCPRPEALSAAVADVYRGWLRAAGKAGDRCVVECGRLLDPWQVVRSGMVPYWCERATRRSVAGAEWWLAGSEAFSSVDVLPEPPGLHSPALAGLPQWLAVASFGRRRAAVDRMAARGYPVTSVPTRHATEVLRAQPYDLPAPSPLRVPDLVAGLRAAGTPHGLLVC
ncbi:hypothetical protein [Plantactinospora sp. KBS50]|uniref:hypothetical protein n=1 Tax=Plantactinospora sp. KBS50 TaxID=2024580 RepID=UPI000BAACFEF|nr:hypothetical protein [Plantactinospora sp. KBS50]ASW57671.1 hypothetical protein CIK06_13690 [Plantactinospora sp. KBS50]